MTYKKLKEDKHSLEAKIHLEKADCLILIICILFFTSISLLSSVSVVESSKEIYVYIFRIACLYSSAICLRLALENYSSIRKTTKKIKDLHYTP